MKCEHVGIVNTSGICGSSSLSCGLLSDSGEMELILSSGLPFPHAFSSFCKIVLETA